LRYRNEREPIGKGISKSLHKKRVKRGKKKIVC
jgi:hypothetical protein